MRLLLHSRNLSAVTVIFGLGQMIQQGILVALVVMTFAVPIFITSCLFVACETAGYDSASLPLAAPLMFSGVMILGLTPMAYIPYLACLSLFCTLAGSANLIIVHLIRRGDIPPGRSIL